MAGTLDIAPLRSLVAVADCGGFQRAAFALHLSQATVSQHLRRLEAAVGRPLVVRQGRGSRFTPDGEQLLAQARRIIALHDESLASLGVVTQKTVLIGSTEHAAAQLLPHLAAMLEDALPNYRPRFRIDRGARLRDGLSAGRIDLALLLGSTDDPRAIRVGELELSWYAGPTWARPDGPIPLVAFDEPCALRTRALDTFTEHGIAAEISAEAPQLAGVQAIVAAGLGVALMATLGQTPEPLVPVDDLPTARPLAVAVWARHGFSREITTATADAVLNLLNGQGPKATTVVPVIELAEGA